MIRDLVRLSFARRRPELGAVIFRLFLGAVLVYGTQDNILSWAQMVEFRNFLEHHGFPYPMVSAHLSVYAQFVAGLLIMLGLFTRQAAAVMIVNFIVALAMVHVGLPFSANIAPLAMLFGSVFLLFHGAGPYSLDARLESRHDAAAVPGGTANPSPVPGQGAGLPISPARRR